MGLTHTGRRSGEGHGYNGQDSQGEGWKLDTHRVMVLEAEDAFPQSPSDPADESWGNPPSLFLLVLPGEGESQQLGDGVKGHREQRKGTGIGLATRTRWEAR